MNDQSFRDKYKLQELIKREIFCYANLEKSMIR